MDCCFCEEYYNPLNNQYYNEFGRSINIPSRILFETDNWYVVPTIGCLTVGYVLLVCKNHHMSLANLSFKLYTEMLEIKKTVTKILEKKTGLKCITFEHGVTHIGFTGTNSVNHVHMHIVPCQTDIWSNILRNHRNVISFFDYVELFEFWQHNYPHAYLIFQDIEETIHYIPDSSGFPSQFFRRHLAASLGMNEWDWRKECYIENLIATHCLLSTDFSLVVKNQEICSAQVII